MTHLFLVAALFGAPAAHAAPADVHVAINTGPVVISAGIDIPGVVFRPAPPPPPRVTVVRRPVRRGVVVAPRPKVVVHRPGPVVVRR